MQSSAMPVILDALSATERRALLSDPAMATLQGVFGAFPDPRGRRGRWYQDEGALTAVFFHDTRIIRDPSLYVTEPALPHDVIRYHTYTDLSRTLEAVSGTGCYSTVSQQPIPRPGEPGAFLVRFLNDQQDCVT